jgi:hypothetical protein
MPKAANAEMQPDRPPVSTYPYEPIDMDMSGSKVAPFDGAVVIISDDETKPGRPAKWYSSRRREGVKLIPWSAWVDPVTRAKISMVPICWRAQPWFEAV